MKLFTNFHDAKEAMESAHRIMYNNENTARRRLSAMLTAIVAERSIEIIDQKNGADSDPEFWQRQYDQVKAFYDAYVAAERRANEASLRAYQDSMRCSFDELPGGLKEAMDASFNPVDGWTFVTDY